MKFLNVACGNRFHKNWINIDFHTASCEVIAINIVNGLPFANNSFDVVYSSHFLEHLTKNQADFVLSEIFRVLNHGGIFRIVVPDLENICREYLDILSNIQDNNNKKKYEWTIIELLDQLVRTESGGEMLKMYKNDKTLHDGFMKEYIFKRVGVKLNDSINSPDIPIRVNMSRKFNFEKLKNKVFYTYIGGIKKLFPKSIKNSVILNTSVGERHLWMYDRYSLSEKLQKNRFKDVKFFSHNQSQIPEFLDYYLDTNIDGTPYKGISSLYCESVKP